MKRCGISFEALADYFDGKADSDTSAQIRKHIDAGCPHCQENLVWLQHGISTFREAQRVRVPEGLVARMQALFGEQFQAPARPSVMARLRFDSRSTLALAGARGAGADAFKLIYSTDSHDIDLWEERNAEGNWYLIGQVLPSNDEEVLEPQEVVLTAASGEKFSAVPNAAEFHLPSVPEGIYHMSVRFADVEVSIPELTIGMARN